MRTLYLILFIIAAVLFAVAIFLPTFTPATTEGRVRPGVNLIAAGLLAWVLVPLIQTADRMGD